MDFQDQKKPKDLQSIYFPAGKLYLFIYLSADLSVGKKILGREKSNFPCLSFQLKSMLKHYKPCDYVAKKVLSHIHFGK